MALSTRHRWCVGKIVEAFSPEVDDLKVQALIRQEENHQRFSALFRGDPGCPTKLFVYYQSRIQNIAGGSNIPSQSTEANNPPASSASSGASWSQNNAVNWGDGGLTNKQLPELFISEGEIDEALSHKCCYFLRNVPVGQAVDMSKEGEPDLLFGELSGHPLSSIESILSHCYKPLFEAAETNVWGKAGEEQRADFLGEMDNFIHNLTEALKSLAGGLELRHPDPKVMEEMDAKGPSLVAKANRNPELFNHFEGLLEEWCNQIESYLEVRQAGKDGTNNNRQEQVSLEPVDEGPMCELEYWRNRMQRLTSITEQLRRKDCKAVIGLLTAMTKNTADQNKQKLVTLLRRWKQIDVNITEAANEAKDNVKYLFTLSRFIEPLYSGTAATIIDTLPALMNSIKMIHTIARYYNTTARMTSLLAKITEQMIRNCKTCITGGSSVDVLWEKDPPELVRQLEGCLKLNEAYQEQYQLTKKKLQQMPKGKQFDFTEMHIFGKFDLFCRRIIKLIDMFSTIDQFTSLSQNKLEGMEALISHFHSIVKEFRLKRHDLLDYHNNKFDRDYVEFNVKIADLEGSLQLFINQSFENITSIEHSLNLLRKFQSILQRESLKSDLDSKLNIIFQNYGMELEQVQQLYEKQKHDPLVPRNLPPVAGNITWSRHLLKRIEEPMKQFERNQNVLAGKDAKRIIKMYNKVARTLVAFEHLWYQAWVQSIDQAKAGLQATLIIRHPDDGKLYVNFDQEIVQLIREAKCLDRMGIEIPEAAKIALFQEEKFKMYYNELHWALMEYDRVITRVIPVTAMVLRPHFKDMEYKLRPGMVTLTWTSMNIDAYVTHVRVGLQKLEELVKNINDIIENRVEKSLKVVSKTLLVDLPDGQSFTVEDSVKVQEKHITAQSMLLQGKNVEIEHAVEDLIKMITAYSLDSHVDSVLDSEILKLRRHYNHFMYQALLHCAKNSMNTLKKRIASRAGSITQLLIKPFFEVSVHLSPPNVILQPSLDEIQDCINKSAQAILRCFSKVHDWNLDGNPSEATAAGSVPNEAIATRTSFFERVTKDIEIVRVALLLTGCIQGIRNTVQEYLGSFFVYDWLWRDNKDACYAAFKAQDPTLDQYRDRLREFDHVESKIDTIPAVHTIGALSLDTTSLKGSFKSECNQWKIRFADNLHSRAKDELERLTEYIRVTMGKLTRDVNDLDTLRFMMLLLKEVRAKEADIEKEMDPIANMYYMLESFLPAGFMEKEEIDKKTVLRTAWKKLVKQAEARTDELAKRQARFKRGLIRDIRLFVDDVTHFREDFLKSGPMVQGIDPMIAVEKLKRFKEEFKIRERKFNLYQVGEEIFAMPTSKYPLLTDTSKDLEYCDQLFGLYTDVLDTLSEWSRLGWNELIPVMPTLAEKMDSFSARIKKLPAKLREWEAFKQLRQKVEDFQVILPLLQELSKDSVKKRHWDEVVQLCQAESVVEVTDGFPGSLPLQDILKINLLAHKEDVEEITDGADKQRKIEKELREVTAKWAEQCFTFQEWKGRGIMVLKGTVGVMEELEESQMKLQQVLTQRHVAPFRAEAQDRLSSLSDTSDTLERWVKVQMMWCSLESVFTGGDIAKQMPVEAKKFSKIDKDWQKIMAQAYNVAKVVEASANEVLKASLPVMYAELEKCQKSLEGYLEQKRNKFPRFFFVSNPGLLMILSQGSDPLSMNEHYEKVFDALENVDHNRKDKTIIEVMNGDQQKVPFSTPVRAISNIEDWLSDLLKNMQVTMKDLCRICAADIAQLGDIVNLRRFVDNNIAQFALLGIQLLWTMDCQTALEQCRAKKNIMKETNQKQLQVLHEMSSWCLQDLGSKANRRKIETLVTIHVHQRDVMSDLTALNRQKRIQDANDFEWLKQARFYWRPNAADECTPDGACVISITDVDFNYQYEYLGSKERLVVTPLTDRCYITLAQALGMYFGGAPAGPAGTGKTETVKDLGRTLGIFVVVTNCTDQQKYTDCAKIFKGLCQGGLWGCFDEFNRILLPVLSVVAQQVLAIQNAKKAGVEYFQFPGDPQNVLLKPCCGFFITMNPGYAGRQELPENLKALFRGVAMMTPDFQIIKKVKLCSVGYTEFDLMAQKFFVLYATCKEQLSAQKHYDWGLRNILAVLRTAGQTKRDNVDKAEAFLIYRTLRDMNLSKLVAQDVPLFLSLLADLFPSIPPPPKGEYVTVEECLAKQVEKEKLVYHPGWVNKVIQLYETTLVRHGIMLVGSAGGGKTKIFDCLSASLTEHTGKMHKQARFNPKALRAPEMYGEVDVLSGEWTTGVFAAMWAKYNNKNNNYNTWIIADGPVDAIWIEDLNTVLDDNKLLTLANGDRIPMTDNVKLMFEVETLMNASPATVSRAGIIYVSDTDLDWAPVMEAWIRLRPAGEQKILRELQLKWLGENTPTDVGHCIDFLNRNTEMVLPTVRVGMATSLCDLFAGLTDTDSGGANISSGSTDLATNIEKLFLYCLCWSLGALLEQEDRVKFDHWMRDRDTNKLMPIVEKDETIYEYFVNLQTLKWDKWRPPPWTCPKSEKLDFSNLLVPTMDSTRAIFLLQHLHKQKKPVLVTGAEGTAKTSTNLMFLKTLNPDKMLVKRINFSSATTPFMCQNAIEVELDKRGGKSFGPPGGKRMTIFIDDLSMPERNKWGDQPTLEMVRLVVEYSGFPFLDKDKRGDFKNCEDLQYIAAMGHPGGGKNDIPNRLKRNFFIFNLVLPSITSINDIYGQMLQGRFTKREFSEDAMSVVENLTRATIQLWRTMKEKMLPTPAKFHYIFNMRELSRVFQGVLLTPKDTIRSGGGLRAAQKSLQMTPGQTLLSLWRHECERVFSDKLTNNTDKDMYSRFMQAALTERFSPDLLTALYGPKGEYKEFYMVNFLRDDVYDADGVLQEEAPKVYEPGGSLQQIRERVEYFAAKYNEDFPSKKMELVLFDDALRHLLRINRLLEMPRGSALLVGVGGSGKQSLTRLTAYICRATCFQITLTKSYNIGSLMEDLKLLYKSAGQLRKQTCFLFTESEIKDEVFLELINSILMTGEVPGLFAKEEYMAMTADLRNAFLKDRPGLEETQENMKQYFIDCVRDNLHLVLCMSPLNPKFPVRARKFPGLISGPTIDWFLPWPKEALVSVSQGVIKDYHIVATEEVKANLMVHMGMVHKMVTEVCDEYFLKMRRSVYQTPKSYLSFIQNFKGMYAQKLKELQVKEERVNLGLHKLKQGGQDVERMKGALADEQKKLEVATAETNQMLASLGVSSTEAKKEGDQVHQIKSRCEEDAARIAAEKAACETDLAKAQPFVDEAETAISSIKPAHIGEIKKLPNPSDIIKLVFDGVLILFSKPLNPVRPATLNVAKKELSFFETSFKPFAMNMLNDSRFLQNVLDFGKAGKDLINEETIEFLSPYMELENFTPVVAKNASVAAEGLCTWVRAMKFYHEASKVVKPKLEALAVAQAQMDAANKALRGAEHRLDACKARLKELQDMFDAQMAEKRRIEDGAIGLQRKMNQASQLIGGLAGEQARWTEDSKNFADMKDRLVGDCAISCAFVSYCGPFNQDFRKILVNEKFRRDCEQRGVPVTKNLDDDKLLWFMVDMGTVGDWNMEGLPQDNLSIQNGILVTRSSRFPLLIDPQAQALGWIRNRERDNVPTWQSTTLTDTKLRDKLEFCMGDGKTLLITQVEEDIDPMLDPVLERQLIVKGKRTFVVVSDKMMDYDPKFRMYFVTRLANPSFSPELQAKTTVVDFTVTQLGLEEQLLGRVIGKEQKALEEQLSQVLEEVNSNRKSLTLLDASLLERLTSNTGNLLEDEELIGVLANTKAKAAEVNQKLISADETRLNINEKREQFRKVAERGSVLYFSIVEMSLVNCMYQTSLDQFLVLFMDSMDKAEKASLAGKRVLNIIETMTYITYRYVNRGLYERDKLTFVLILTLKILITAKKLNPTDLTLFLRGGAALDINSARRKPYVWLTNEAWLNILELSQSNKFFGNLPTDIQGNEAMWRRWYEDNEPEQIPMPDYDQRIAEQSEIGPFLKLLLVRALRVDRCILTCKEFIRNTAQMGPKYVEAVTDTIESIFQEMVAHIPVVFLLSVGADPTDSIETLARKRKLPLPAVISLGEGQEPVAIRAMTAAAANGGWVLLQNCELGIPLMMQMEELISKLKDTMDPGFRLFITALPSPEFPLGLLQMSTKVTNEPPAGLRAGILRSYTVIVDQDRLERVESVQWRQLLFALCFLHSTVQERRKFGPLGWCIPYEYNNGDLTACILFLEKHLYAGPISWPTFQYMVSEAQYGGKITDNMDRRLFKTYTQVWLTPNTCSDLFTYNPAHPIFKIPNDFQYKIGYTGTDINEYRRYICQFPDNDSPEIFGLHPNADLTFRVKEVNALFNTLGETQPKGNTGGSGVSREDVVYEKCSELLERLPEDYKEDDYKVKLNKLGGLTIPLNIFLFQEIQRLQRVIAKVRFMLQQLQLAIKGEVVLSEELAACLNAMYDAKSWVFTVAGDEFSWILPTLGLWFSSLITRDEQMRTWLNNGRPNCYWLTGFFNPQGMLTAMKQEVTRKHKADKWALDDVVYHTEVTTYERVEQVRTPPAEGVYLHGLFLDGAAWSKSEGVLVESEPKRLFVPLPVLHASANVKAEQVKVRRDMFGAHGPYEAPCYKYPIRTDRFLIFLVTLKCTAEKSPAHWTLRGAALLCNTD